MRMVRNFFLVASLIVTSLTSVAAQEHVAQDASNFGKIFANNNQAVTTRESETFAADEFLELVSEMNPQSRIARLARSVGKLDVLTDAGSYVTCTAFLVDGNRLVTSYGCVSGILENPETDGVEVASILFHAGYSGSDSVGAAKTFYVKPTPIETNQMLGYSVLQLIGDANSTFGALTLSADQISDADLLVVIGHPEGEEIRVSRFKCKVSSPSLVGDLLSHTCTILPGNGGSPIISDDTGQVVALQVNSVGSENYAVPFSNVFKSSVILKPSNDLDDKNDLQREARRGLERQVAELSAANSRLSQQLAAAGRQEASQRTRLESLQARLARLEGDLETSEGVIADKDLQIGILRSDLTFARTEAEEAAAAQGTEIEGLRGRNAQLEAQIGALTARAEDTSAQLDTMMADNAALSERLAQAGARAAEADGVVAGLREEIDRLNATLDAAQARDTRRDAVIANLRKALAEAEARAVSDDDDKRSLEERLAAALAARAGVDASVEETRERLVAALAAQRAAEQQLETRLSEADQRSILLSEAREKLAQSEERASAADKQAELLNQQVTQLRRQLAELQALLDDAKVRDDASQAQLQNIGSELNAAIARVAQEERRRRIAEEEKRKLEEERARKLEKENERLQEELVRLTSVVSKKLYGKFEWRSDLPKTLFFDGEITEGDTANFSEALKQHAIDILVLNSPGGNLLEGVRLADVVFDRGIATYVPVNSECVSACVYIFFAGPNRVLDGRVKVHAPLATNNDQETSMTPLQIMDLVAELNQIVLSRAKKFEIPDSIFPLLLTSKEVVDVTSAIKPQLRPSLPISEQISSVAAWIATKSKGLSDVSAECLMNFERELYSQRRARQEVLNQVVSLENRTEKLIAEKTKVEREFAQAVKSLAQSEERASAADKQAELLNQQVTQLRQQLGELQALLDDAKVRDAASQVQLQNIGSELNAAIARVAQEERRRCIAEEEKRKLKDDRARRLEEENRDLARYRSEFFGRLRDVLGRQEGVRVVGDRFVFSSEVLFELGSADLSSAGQQEIAKVARILQDIGGDIPAEIDWIIRVDGHAAAIDYIPNVGNTDFADNWELSQARALSVVRYMINVLGIEPERLSANGFGEYQPVNPANTPQARAQNRRIELKFTER